MNAKDFNLKSLVGMAHSPVRNYAIPGLTSWLIGMPSPEGCIRMFTNERDHQEEITPHSHRFSFQCWVLAGSVRNRIWTRCWHQSHDADRFRATTLQYEGACGKYKRGDTHLDYYTYADQYFNEGECYSMAAHEIHSIHFSRGCKVLFFEGSTVADHSVILEPYVGNEAIPTFKVEPWMFKREST